MRRKALFIVIFRKRARDKGTEKLESHADLDYFQPMGSIAEIEQAIAKLSEREFVELEQWFDAERNRKWDRQIEADSASGALDFLLKEVEEDIAQGRTRPADEILDDPKI